MTQDYDSTQDTLDHIEAVRQRIYQVIADLSLRGAIHDQSKLQSPEKEMHDRINPRLRDAEYGSAEYKAVLAEMGDIPALHYAKNRHHPEHFENGVNGMNLMDVMEMLCDWKAATERNNGNFAKSLEMNFVRFAINEPLARIIRNTAKEMGWVGE